MRIDLIEFIPSAGVYLITNGYGESFEFRSFEDAVAFIRSKLG